MAELSSSDAERIRLEEVYRNEVRRQLQEPTGAKSGLLRFLNSSLGLWLFRPCLSQVPAPLIRVAKKAREKENADFQQRLKEESERRQMVARLDDEISYRLSQALIRLSVVAASKPAPPRPLTSGASQSPSTHEADAHERTPSQIVGRLSAPPPDADGTLYPDFSTYSLPTLIVLLRRSLPLDEERNDVETSLAALATMGKDREGESQTAEQVASILLTDVVLERWKSTRFYYTDCSPERPFC